MYYIYILTKFSEHVPRYVGITNDLTKRLQQHLKDKSNVDKYNWITSNQIDIRVVATANSFDEALIRETQFIGYYRHFQLFNKQKVYTKEERSTEALKMANKRIMEVSKETYKGFTVKK